MNTSRIRISIFAALCAAIFTPSCGVLKPKADPSEHFLLRPVVTGGAVKSAHSDLVISVGPTLVPGYLDRINIVTMASENKLVVEEFDLWGEPIASAISRVVAENLSRRLGSAKVVPFPDVDLNTYDYRVAFWVRRFESDGSGTVVLDCSWGIAGMPGTDGPRVSESSSIKIPVGASGEPKDFSALAAAMSEALAKLSEEVRRSLLKMPVEVGE
jgi:uncharacterized lipoprotein YmbA